MKNLVIVLLVASIVTIFSDAYDAILLWLYDASGFWAGLGRSVIVLGLLSLLGVFDASDKAQNATGETSA